ncbi:WEB family protein At3g02930, chloroplastic-like [Primulina eburnea]|uniref:WEB family protein At3g02930, chloroplastic-like n=1 Tax=Primulina eburnea TaxID=1245227 RepID=UPI003C6CC3D3
MSTKSKSAASETPNTKATPVASRLNKSSAGVAKSGTDSATRRLSVDRSPASVASKTTLGRRSPKLSTSSDNKAIQVSKPSEVQVEYDLAKEDLQKTKEKLLIVESEKAKALDELKEALKLAEEANEKLSEALAAQKLAEENSEIEKFRTIEMEQAGIEAAQKKEEEFLRDLEEVRNLHAMEATALQSVTEELHKVKEELGKTGDAKNLALSHAEEATKLAELHAEKVEALSAEIAHLRNTHALRAEEEANEKNKYVSELKLEIDSLRQELERAKIFEVELAEKEANLEQLNVDLEAAKMAENYTHSLLQELHERVGELVTQADQAKRLERSASESLESVIKQLEGSNNSLHNAESEISSLKEKVVLLETSIVRQKGDLEESRHLVELAKEEASEMVKRVESLISELESAKEEKIQALNNEQVSASSIQTLLEEKNDLINALENSKNEEEKSKKALESLTSALHEVSLEARAAKEKLLSIQSVNDDYEIQIQDLNLVLKETNQRHASMLSDAKQEIDGHENAIKQSKHDLHNLMVEWEQKELNLINSVKKSDEECSSLKNEISRLFNLLKIAEEEACDVKDEGDRWKKSYKEAESELISLKEVISKAEAESMGLKTSLTDRENELQDICHKNEELQDREAASLKKMEELSKLLEEALAKKQEEEHCKLTDTEKDYDMLPKVVECSELNGSGEMKPKVEIKSQQNEQPVKEKLREVTDFRDNEPVKRDFEFDTSNGKLKNSNIKEKANNEPAEVDHKMWESCKIEAKDLPPEEEADQESFEDELESRTESGDGDEQMNGLSSAENLDSGESSPSKQQLSKKKKGLVSKFGSLLKKKGTAKQK